MNKNQLKAMWIAIAIGVIMCIYPPFSYHTERGTTVDRGYKFITSQRGRIQINTSRLVIQLFVVGILAVGAIVTLKTGSNEEKAENIPPSLPPKSTKSASEFQPEVTTSVNSTVSENQGSIKTNETQSSTTSSTPQKKQSFSWKAFIIAFFLATFLNVFISAASGVEPRKNIMWTVFWIYLSIEAWKFWKWKALLPYPLFLILNLMTQAVVTSAAPGDLTSYIAVALFLNIGGLITFYLLLRKSQNNQ